MSTFELKKRYLRELLIYSFNLKKSVAESQELLVEAYNIYKAREYVVSSLINLRNMNLTFKIVVNDSKT